MRARNPHTSPPRAHIDGEVRHLDVGSSHPGAGEGPKGWAVRPLKWHASWVQNVPDRHFESAARLALCECFYRLKSDVRYKTSDLRLIKGGFSGGAHLFPFRTEKLSPPEPMVLRNSGR
uniref:Uncharacterized protein n=1 Tax=Parastrongyloides trichosuri TaxID=131310 RepID=A0A0N5A5Z7_PARTI